MQSLSKMMPAVEDFERRLGILKQVEPIIENAVKTLQKAIDLTGSPLEPPKPKVVPKKQEIDEDELSLESLAQAAAAPAASSAGGLDLGALTALLGGQQASAPAEIESADSSSDTPDLSALLGAT